ncbi:amino acid kinase family protein [Nonlabens antarcticus]|uniref:hypothetical protein n=1 Tax=Nonlabens antarcticus TaxID=392714 RepID=UPI00189161B7|nr:hypothetical protein [Nonlabens antarcticus]
MKLTLILLLIAFGCYIGYRIALQMAHKKDPNDKPGCVLIGYVTLVYLCMCSLSFPFIGITVAGLYATVAHDRFEATVTQVRQYESEDDEGNYHTMYSPTVIFTNSSGAIIERELNISSGDPYYVGEKHPITYDVDSDKVSSRSMASVLLLTGGLIMSLLLLGYVIIGFAYAYTIPIEITGMDYTVIIFLYIIMPLGMIGMNVGLIYYMVQRIFYDYKSDHPVWVLFLVGFFILVLTLASVGIVKLMWKKKKTKNL